MQSFHFSQFTQCVQFPRERRSSNSGGVECADGTLAAGCRDAWRVVYAIFAIRTLDYLTVFDVCPTESPHTVVQ